MLLARWRTVGKAAIATIGTDRAGLEYTENSSDGDEGLKMIGGMARAVRWCRLSSVVGGGDEVVGWTLDVGLLRQFGLDWNGQGWVCGGMSLLSDSDSSRSTPR
jgi:hypothetical protein